MNDLVDISPDHLKVVQDILRENLPSGVAVWAFGSRVSWATSDSSDLDLALEGDIDHDTILALEMAFEESRLPYTVDIIDLNQVSDSFRRIVDAQKIPLADADKPRNSVDQWPRLQFGDCVKLVRDTVLPTDLDDVPYIDLEHMGEGTLSLVGCGNASDVSSITGRFRRGDILFGKLRPYLRKMIRADFDGVCSTDIWVVRPTTKTDADYLFYLMASKEFVDVATRSSEGTKIPRAKWEWISRYEIPIPPLSDQRTITHILRTLDAKIKLNRRMNQTLEGMARALFKSWFVDFDPVRAKMDGTWKRGESLPGLPAHLYEAFPDGMAESELDIPEGWDLKSLDEITDFRNGPALQNYKPVNNEPRLPVVKIAQLKNGRVGGKEWAKESITPECIIDDGDVIFSWSGGLLVKVWCGGRAVLNQDLFKVTSIKYPKWFFLSWVEQYIERFQGIATDKATTMGHICRHHLRVECVIPDKTFLNMSNNIFESLFTKQVLNNIQSRSLVNLRDALLSKLMSGELWMSPVTRQSGK